METLKFLADNSLNMQLSYYGTGVQNVFDDALEVLAEQNGRSTIKDLLHAIEHVASRDLDAYNQDWK